MRRTLRNRIAAGALAMGLALTACGTDDGAEDAGGPTSDIKVGLAYDIGGRGDQSFNDSAARGLDKAKDEYGIQAQELEAAAGETDAEKEDRLRNLAEADFNPIIAVGFAYAPAMDKVAPDFPEVSFVLIDSADAKGDNIANLTFAEHEGSFLVGVAAGLKTETDNVGFVGGVNVPLIHKFEVGFTEGVKAANPEAKVQVKYLTQPPNFDGFNDPARGQTAANGMFDAGADIIFAAAGGSGNGVFEAAKAQGAKAIGVDSDQYNQPTLADVKDVIMTSMLKQVDVAVFDIITAFEDGEFQGGEQVYDLTDNGVSYSTSGGMIDDITDQIDEYKQKIIDGEIEVSSTK